ncbi:MAG TPA: T9SS type A sorting domain-containing protein [Chitinophagaceae bacterium]
MKKFLAILLIILCNFYNVFSQSVKLTAIYDFNNSAVKLNWNMVSSDTRTSYLLLRSADGVSWMEAAKDRMLRNYTNDDIYFFNDRKFSPGKNYYRIKIADGDNNTIALSPVVVVNTKGTAYNITTNPINTQSQTTGKQTTSPKIDTRPQGNGSWVLYPNPATDLLKLAYKGSNDLKGVVNVQIQDATGKIVIKFRSGSMYKLIQIPITNLQKGIYFIQLTVMNELMMSQQFLKQ